MSPLYCKPEIIIALGVGVLIAFRLHKWLMRLSPDPRAPCAGRLCQTEHNTHTHTHTHTHTAGNNKLQLTLM